MEFELVPDPGADDPVTRAVVAALSRSGLVEGESGAESRGAWRRAGLEEALERNASPSPHGAGSPPGGAMGRGSVPPAPRSRGATRA